VPGAGRVDGLPRPVLACAVPAPGRTPQERWLARRHSRHRHEEEPMRPRWRVLPTLALALATTVPQARSQPEGPGAGTVRPERVDYRADRILATRPVVVAFEGPRALLVFETAVPTPPARIYFGTTPESARPGFPRFRKTARELLPEGTAAAVTHSVKIDLRALEEAAGGCLARQGGDVEYRLEIYDPGRASVFTYDSRFRYSRKGAGESEYSVSPVLLEGPFVDAVTHDSAVISWRADRRHSGAVLIGEKEYRAGGASERAEVRVTGLSPATSYSYRVRFSDAGDVSREYAFRTAPPPGRRTAIAFGFLGDSRRGVGGGEEDVNGVNAKTLQALLTALYRAGADFILFGGDLIDGYTSSEDIFVSQLRSWKKAAQPVGALVPIYECMGNHEQLGDYFRIPCAGGKGSLVAFADREGEASAEGVFARELVNPVGSAYGFGPPAPESRAQGLGGREYGPSYSESVYSFNYGNVHVVAANSDYWYTGVVEWGCDSAPEAANPDDAVLALLGGNREGYVRENQLAWLDRDLAAAQRDPDIDLIFVFTHEPPFPNGGHVEDAMYWGRRSDGASVGYNDREAPLGDVLDMRERFWGTIARYDKVAAVFASDEHNYSRTIIDASVNPAYEHPVWQLVSGGGGAPYYTRDTSVPWADNVRCFSTSRHCCLVTVEGRRAKLEVFSDSGELLDTVEDLAAKDRK